MTPTILSRCVHLSLTPSQSVLIIQPVAKMEEDYALVARLCLLVPRKWQLVRSDCIRQLSC